MLLTMPALVSAQSITDPTIIEFTPSGAPNALDVRTGTPLVQKYTLDIYLAGTGTLVRTVDLGNPLPGLDGLIRVDFVSLLAAPLSTGVVYDAVVNVIGPLDTRSSVRSETFAYSTACTPTISPSSATFSTSAAANGSVGVTANTNCAWNATSNASWITITANAFGTGNATVNYTVAANTLATSRTGTMTIGGPTFTVTQAGAPCTFTISSSTANLTSSAAMGTVTVTAASGCSWTATSNAAWLTIASGASGNGNGTVTYNVADNTGSAARTGILTIAGQSFTVTQAAPSCVSLISPLSSTLSASIAASGSVAVTASAGCSWTAVSNDPWITVSVGATGTGNGYVAYGVAANTGSALRTGRLIIGGYVFTITQPGAPCAFTVSPWWSNLTSPAAANGTVSVSGGSGCSWTATSNAAWITITSGASGTGSGSVNYTVAANTGTTSRSGTMTIAGMTYTVSQPASSCSFTISPTAQAFGASGGSGIVTVTTSANCSWTASSNAAWVTISGGATGTGSGTVAFNVAANTGTVSRSATLTIGGKSFTVTEGGPCSFGLSPWLISAPAAGISGSITVTTQPGCSWTATTASAWITVSGSGVGSGTVAYTVQPNTGTLARSGSVTVGNVSVGVNQTR